MSTNRQFTQADYSGGSFWASEFPFVAKQVRKRALFQRDMARLIDTISELELHNVAPDEALAKIERRSGVRGVMEALRRWLRADREARD